ncbi:MAG: hypothetical protein OXD50_07955 [Chloroflexi bacterium]|nr:hypothetical protein [Chloroflexota bacterium]
MALNPIRIRRSIVDIGANDAQADEFTEAVSEGFEDLVTKDDLRLELQAMEQRIVNRLLIAMIGIAAVIIGAVALLTQL